MTEHGTSLYETAAIFKIAAASTIRNWKKQFEVQGKDALQPKKKGRLFMKKETAKQSKKIAVEGSTQALQARIPNQHFYELNYILYDTNY